MNDQRHGAERVRSRTCQLCGAMLASMLLLGTSVQAQQSSGFGGSFEPPETAPSGQEVDQPGQGGGIPPGGGDGFGGGVSGSDGFGGGSFVTGGAGGDDAGAVPEAGGSGAGEPGSEGFGGGSFVTGGAGGDGASPQPEAGGSGAGGPGSDGFGGGAVVGGEAGGGGAGPMAQLIAFELQDFGISPTQTLYQGASHGPTPTLIPGGEVITTADLIGLMQQQIVLIDVLGGNMTLPGALSAAGLGAPGSFNDQVQAIMVQGLQQVTGGNRQTPVVFFCLSPHCWLSYNAALRAIAAGYSNVLWYRGGVEAWAMAGLDLVPARGS